MQGRNKVNPPSRIATSRGPRHDQVLQLVSYGEPRPREVLPRLRRQVLRRSDARLCVRRFARRAAVHDAGTARGRDSTNRHRAGRHGGLAVDPHDLGARPPRPHDHWSPAKAPNHPCSTLDGADDRGDGDRDHQPAFARSGGPDGRIDDAQQRAPAAAALEPRGTDHRPTRCADRGDTRGAAGCGAASDPNARSTCGRSTDGPVHHERREGAPVARDEPGGPGTLRCAGARRSRGAATSAAQA